MPLEYLKTGLPLIISDNSGMQEYINPDYMIPIPCHEKCSTLGKEFGVDYAADEDKLKEAILWAYNNRQASLDMGRRASAWVSANWGYDKTARGMIKIAEEICLMERQLESA
jgi:glycosyltransferase involved in cell wall biosynthesis